jgi:hypothetical protein
MSRLPSSRLHLVLLSTVAALLIAPTAEAQVVLRPKHQPKTQRTFHVENSTKQVLKLNGMDIETESLQFIIVESSTATRGDDGSLRVTDAIKKLQQELTLPGLKVSFDSSNPDKKAPLPQLEPLFDVMRVIAKSRYTYVYDKADKLLKIEGADEALKDLDPALRKSLTGQLGAKSLLKQSLNQSQRILAKPVRKGDKWQHTTIQQLEAGQTLTVKRRYTYSGTVKKGDDTLHRITSKALEVTLTQDAPEGSASKLTASKLKVAKAAGEILVDLKKGTIVSETDSTQMTGTLTLEINGMSFDGTLDLTIATKSQLQP